LGKHLPFGPDNPGNSLHQSVSICISMQQSAAICRCITRGGSQGAAGGSQGQPGLWQAGTLPELCRNSAGTLLMHYQGQPDGEGQGWSIGWSIGWNSADALPGGAARGQPGAARGSQGQPADALPTHYRRITSDVSQYPTLHPPLL
jgi:hypothetical protein